MMHRFSLCRQADAPAGLNVSYPELFPQLPAMFVELSMTTPQQREVDGVRWRPVVPAVRRLPLRMSAAWVAASDWWMVCVDLRPNPRGSSPTGPEMWRASLSHVLILLKCTSVRWDVVEGHSSAQRQWLTEEVSQFPFLLWQRRAGILFQIKAASISLMARFQDLDSGLGFSPTSPHESALLSSCACFLWPQSKFACITLDSTNIR